MIDLGCKIGKTYPAKSKNIKKKKSGFKKSDMIEISKRVKLLMKEKNINETKLSRLSKIPQSSLNDSLNNNRKFRLWTLENLIKIKEFFGVSFDFLIYGENNS